MERFPCLLTSTLTFNNSDGEEFSDRIPTFISSTQLEYNIAVGPDPANWTVKVLNGIVESNAYPFTVVTIPTAGVLSVSPGTGLSASGPPGGLFSPSSQTYTLTNTGGTSVNWTAGKTQSWVTLSKSSGTLAAGGQDQVTVSINSGANSLAASGSPYSDTVTFTNTTNGNGSQSRTASLTITSVVGHTLNIANAASGTPNPVIPRGAANLSVIATDSLGHALGYAWEASCLTLSSNGNFTGSATRTPTWLAPENDTGSLQNCTLQVTVSDELGLSRQSFYSHGVNPGGATSLSIVDGISLLEPPPYELNGTAMVEATIKNTGSATVVLDRFQAIGEFTDQFGSVYQRTWPAEQFQPPLSLAPGAWHQYTKLLTDSFPALATTAVVMIHVKFDNIAGQQPITNAESGATAQLVFEVGHRWTSRTVLQVTPIR